MRDVPSAEFLVGTWHVRWHARLTSTQDAARDMEHHSSRLVIVADEQTAGRGQYGRRWQSPQGGNLLATFVVPAQGMTANAVLPLGASLAVCDTLATTGIKARCKWPNDTMVDGAKIAGVLIEADGRMFRLGIGLNVQWPATLRVARTGAAWTSMYAETDCTHDRVAVLRTLCACLDTRLAQSAGETIAAYRARWLKPAGFVRVRTGTAWVRGRAQGIGTDGRLLVVLAGGEPRTISSSAQIRYS